jgi:hypothetical protein
MRIRRRFALTAAASIALAAGCRHGPPHYTPAQEEDAFSAELKATKRIESKEFANLLQEKVKFLWKETFDLGNENLKRHDQAGGLLSVTEPDCFNGGCMRQLVFKNRAAASFFEENLLVGPNSPLRPWPGRRYRGPIIDQPEGGVRATWALLIDPNEHRRVEGLQLVGHASRTPEATPKSSTISDIGDR